MFFFVFLVGLLGGFYWCGLYSLNFLVTFGYMENRGIDGFWVYGVGTVVYSYFSFDVELVIF